MGLKHGKYIYVERGDGLYVKIRLLGIRFKKGGKKSEADYNDPSRYVVLPVKQLAPPRGAVVIKAEDLPEAVRRLVEEI